MNDVQLGDETTFVTTITENGAAVPIQTTTVRQFIFVKPALKPVVGGPVDTRRLVKTAVFVASGANGQLKYKALPGEIDRVGTWLIQAKVTFPDGSFSSQVDSFIVRENL